ncbi:MAG: DUF551 domain-containing protein [Oscillospiraceae bacterium]
MKQINKKSCLSSGNSNKAAGEENYNISLPISEQIVKGGSKMSEWIKVEDRLPKTNEKVLCCYHFNKHIDMPFISVLSYYASDEVPHFQHTLGDDKMRVTHWMPLPEPPKEGE